MKKQEPINLTESQLKKMINEAVKTKLTEGFVDERMIKKWDYLIDNYGADKVCENLALWLDVSVLEQIIEWFEEEGYFEGSEFDDNYNDEDFEDY